MLNKMFFIKKYLTVLILFIFTSGFLFARSPEKESASEIKYIFYFIGDGVGYSHLSLTEAYLANIENRIGVVPLKMTGFPVHGMVNTFAKNRQITGSAAAASSLAYGIKENINNLSYFEGNYKNERSLLQLARENGLKTGVVTNVSIDHATPAAFFANATGRNQYYEIGLQLADSEIDFIGGGGFRNPKGYDNAQKNLYEIMKEKNYHLFTDIYDYSPSHKKLYFFNPVIRGAGDMPYAMDKDREGGYSLTEIVNIGIDFLENDNGFLMIIEGGKIDWAAHRNDAAAIVHDIIDFDNSVKSAYDFLLKYPDETLIIVTSDHETGGLSLGIDQNGYQSNFEKLNYQKISQAALSSKVSRLFRENPNTDIEDVFNFVTEKFFSEDFMFNNYEKEMLTLAVLHYRGEEEVSDAKRRYLYRGYCPISFTCTKIINNRASVGFTTEGHTAAAVPIFSIGQGSRFFGSYLDNTDIPLRIIELMGWE